MVGFINMSAIGSPRYTHHVCRKLLVKTVSVDEVNWPKTGKTLTLLESTQIAKLSLLFNNVNAIGKV